METTVFICYLLTVFMVFIRYVMVGADPNTFYTVLCRFRSGRQTVRTALALEGGGGAVLMLGSRCCRRLLQLVGLSAEVHSSPQRECALPRRPYPAHSPLHASPCSPPPCCPSPRPHLPQLPSSSPPTPCLPPPSHPFPSFLPYQTPFPSSRPLVVCQRIHFLYAAEP